MSIPRLDPAVSYLVVAAVGFVAGLAVGAWAAEHVTDGLLNGLIRRCALAGTLVVR